MAKSIFLCCSVFLFSILCFTKSSYAKTISAETSVLTIAGDIRSLYSSPSGKILKISTDKEFILYDLKNHKKITPFENTTGFDSRETVWLSPTEDKAFAFASVGLVSVELDAVWKSTSAVKTEVLYFTPKSCYLDDFAPALLHPNGLMFFVETCEEGEQTTEQLILVDTNTKKSVVLESSSAIRVIQGRQPEADMGRLIQSDRLYYIAALPKNPKLSALKYYDFNKNITVTTTLDKSPFGDVGNVLFDHFSPNSSQVAVNRCGSQGYKKTIYNIDTQQETLMFGGADPAIHCIYTTEYLTIIGDVFYATNFSTPMPTMFGFNTKTNIGMNFSNPFMPLHHSSDGLSAVGWDSTTGDHNLLDFSTNTKKILLDGNEVIPNMASYWPVFDLDNHFSIRLDLATDWSSSKVSKVPHFTKNMDILLGNIQQKDNIALRYPDCYKPQNNILFCTRPYGTRIQPLTELLQLDL